MHGQQGAIYEDETNIVVLEKAILGVLGSKDMGSKCIRTSMCNVGKL